MRILFFTFFLVLGSKSVAQKITLFKNGTIYTSNQNFDVVNAFVVRDGTILDIGTEPNLKKKYKITEQVDLHGKFVYPGFIDPHAHFMGYCLGLGQCDLIGTKSFEEIIGRLEQWVKDHPKDEWIIGRGWDQNDWNKKEFPTKEVLDDLFPNKNIVLTRIDGHALLANSQAIQKSKASPETKINGGQIVVEDGQLTGVFIDNAMGLIKRIIPPTSPDEQKKLLIEGQKKCFEVGLTTISDAGVSQEDIELMMKLQNEGSIKIRDYAMVSIGLRNIDYFTKKGIIKTPKMNVRSFKLYADGALGSRGASLIEPYSDEPSNKGLLLLSDVELDKYYQQIIKSDYQANTHCIGDNANRTVLNLYSKYLSKKNDRRWRVEHAQVIHKDDFAIFQDYQIIPSVQSTHATSDMYWAEKRLGKERLHDAYAYKKLLNTAGIIANGSDFPVESINPLKGFFAAVFRMDESLYPNGGFQKENALSRQEALKAMTIWAAYANFEEKEKGSIEKGKFADFVVLDTDLIHDTPKNIIKSKVLKTYLNGQIVFQK